MEHKISIDERLELMSHPGLTVPEIQKLFDVKQVTARKIRKKAIDLGGSIELNRHRVKTTCVYEAMGIDLAEETARLKRQL